MKQRDRILEIARTQLGYKEGPNNDTKYGDWYGLPNNPWCQMFISRCADQAGIGTDIIPRAASCPTALEWFMKRDGRIGDIPAQPGDLVFYEWSGETAARAADHVGIVEKVEGSEPSEQVLTTIEGNYNDNVQRRVVRYRDMGLKAICRPRYTDHEEEKKVQAPFVLSQGDTGQGVQLLQMALLLHGYDVGVYGMDGQFGQATRAALLRFQTEKALEADGICGTEVWTALCAG